MDKSLIDNFIEKHQLSGSFCDIAPKWYIPITKQLLSKSALQQAPYFIGINGCQGSGKSTLTDFIAEYLTEKIGLNVAILSLDDFYLDQTQRKTLASSVHPLFETRGVPGTHNTKLIQHVLMSIKNGQFPVALPRFDKATDNPKPTSQWPVITETPDIVIFEGWCWGVPPQSEEELHSPVNELETDKDPDGIWRAFSNQVISAEYAPLYTLMDNWIMLKAPSFECVSQWRKEQEHKLAAKVGTGDNNVMTDQQVDVFIQHYQRLTEQCLEHIPAISNIVIELNADRDILSVSGLEPKVV